MRARYVLGAVLALLPVAASASETITYKYDAKGRLTKVAHSGSVNSNVVADYTFDAADNRINVTVSGVVGSGGGPAGSDPGQTGGSSTGSDPGQSGSGSTSTNSNSVVVVPLNGFTIIVTQY